MGEFKEVNEDSKYLYFIADNQTQYVWCDMIWEKLGGYKLDSTEVNYYITPDKEDWAGVMIGAIFLIMAPRANLIRSFLGHGTSDKAIFKFQGFRGAVGMDYYFMTGHKEKWHFGKHGHALQHPYNKVLEMGLPRSDLFIPERRYKKEDVLRELGIETDRKIVLFAPTFNTGSLEYYYYDVLKQLYKDYFVVIKKHDREFFFGDTSTGGKLIGRKFDDTVFDIKPKTRKKLTKNLFEYRGMLDPVKFISIADYYIGDCSSMDYLTMFADIPMVMIHPYKNAVMDVAYEYDVRNTCPFYQRGADLVGTLKRAEDEAYRGMRKEFIKKNFYFNDGHAQERMCDHAQTMVERLKKRIGGWEDPHFKKQQMILDTVVAARDKMREEVKNEQPFDCAEDIK